MPRSRSLPLVLICALCLLGSALAASAQASGGSVLGWGDDSYGQIGDGTTGGFCACSKTAIPTVGIASATEVAAGSLHTLALLSNGTVVSWGGNPWGQLGNGTPSLKSAVRGGPVTRKIGGTGTFTPVAIGGLSNVVAVAAGRNHSLALLADGTVRSWGGNEYGQLGIGNSTGPETCEATPCARTPVSVPGLAGVIAISAHGDDNLALLADGTVMAWGYDFSGQSGNGVGMQTGCQCADHPVLVPGVGRAVAIAAGSGAEAALHGDGTVETWGADTSGELGDGSTAEPGGCECRGPGPVSSIAGIKSIAMGNSSGFAVRQAGGGLSWGFNLYGELGNGSLGGGTCSCVPTPAPISAGSDLHSIAGGGTDALGLLSSGAVISWGENEEGQRGNGSTGPGDGVPTPVLGVSGASAIAAGPASSFAIAGPSQTLAASLAGAGAGSVGTAGLVCPGACSARYPQSQVETLRADPAPGSGFAGFSGACTGTGVCRVQIDADRNVTATFGPPKGTAITGVAVSRAKRTATLSFTAPGAITGFECELIKPRAKHLRRHGHRKRRSMKGSPKKEAPKFSACASGQVYKHLLPGSYTFEVRALDILGADAVPATTKFTLKKPKKKKRHHRHKR